MAFGPRRLLPRPVPTASHFLDFDRQPELEAMAHLLGCYCLDFDRYPELEAMAHLLGCYCLDFGPCPVEWWK
jgi:hypothetical protein